MSTFHLYILTGPQLKWLADVEAEDIDSARLQYPELATVALQFDREDKPLIGDPIKPTGQCCVGVSFDITNDAGEVLLQARLCGWDCQICGWDCEILGNCANGSQCKICKRIVKDRVLGVVYSEPVNARYVYFEQYKIWKLIQVG